MPKDLLQMEAFTHAMRYGKIIHDRRWDEEEGNYKGANRLVIVEFGPWRYCWELLNGEIIRVGQEMTPKALSDKQG